MSNFFLNLNNNFTIELFSCYHILIVMVTIIFAFLIINNKDYFVNLSPNNKRKLRHLLLLILIINFILRRGSFIYYSVYDWRIHLDINFCNFTSVMFLIYTLTGKKSIYKICYFMTFVGPLLSIIFPSTNLSPFNYSFYSFLIIHHVIFIFNIAFMYTEDLKYNIKDFIEYLIFIINYLIIIYIFDYLFDVSYNIPTTFLNSKLESIELINKLFQNNLLVFSIFLCVIVGFSLIGLLFLKLSEKRIKN